MREFIHNLKLTYWLLYYIIKVYILFSKWMSTCSFFSDIFTWRGLTYFLIYGFWIYSNRDHLSCFYGCLRDEYGLISGIVSFIVYFLNLIHTCRAISKRFNWFGIISFVIFCIWLYLNKDALISFFSNLHIGFWIIIFICLFIICYLNFAVLQENFSSIVYDNSGAGSNSNITDNLQGVITQT